MYSILNQKEAQRTSGSIIERLSGTKYLEQVRSYKYPESIVNRKNSSEEEVRERIAVGSKAYYAN